MKLWEKGYQLDDLVEKFMTGDDPLLDQALIQYDCLGSIAHAKMLHHIGILTNKECQLLAESLAEIIQLEKEGRFSIRPEDEDVHTAIENALVEKLGPIGKKLHTARSRNDQVLLDIRLYAREWVLILAKGILEAITVLLDFAEENHDIAIPGRTHFQRAMPSSLGLWAGAFAESFLDNIEFIKTAYWLIDQCPLGSAASYGVSLEINRKLTSDLLGFRTVQNNVLYANNSRGKFEAIVLSALVQVMGDLSKICTDIIYFSAPEFGYLCLPEEFCPGSSLMPQKRNPCPLELIRAKSASVQGMLIQVLEIIRGLPSGYNRDFQETKRPLMQGFEITTMSIRVFKQIFSHLKVDKEKCLKAFTSELFATDKVLDLVKKGRTFREAYKEVALSLKDVVMEDPVVNILSKTHQGATGNLGIMTNRIKMNEYQKWMHQTNERWEAAKSSLLEKEKILNLAS